MPSIHADRITTPLLIAHGDLDPFPLSQSEEMFSALWRLRREVTYVTYWGEAHGNLSPPNVRDLWARIFDWYADRLGQGQLYHDERAAKITR